MTNPKTSSFQTRFLSFVLPLALGYFLSWVVKTWILTPLEVDHDFMEPTITKNTRITLQRMFLGKNIGIGDIVLAKSPTNEELYVLARIVGKPGDTIEVQKRVVLRNGEILDPTDFPRVTKGEIPLFPKGKSEYDDSHKLLVPDKHFYLLSDNLEKGVDSRVLGPFPESSIVGKKWN